MYKQAPKSPILKALVGNQPNLPEGLREAIEATPNKMMDSPAKQAAPNRDHYYDLRPKNAKTYADSAAAEATYFSGSRKLGEVTGIAASGGKYLGGQMFRNGPTPNSANAKEVLKKTRAAQENSGLDYKDAYPESPSQMKSPAKQSPKNKKKAAAVEALRRKNQSRIMNGRIRSDWEKSTEGKSKAVAPITQQLPLERIKNQNVGKQVLNERKAEMKKDGFSGSTANLALHATNNQVTAAELKRIKGRSKTFGEYADNVEKRFPNR